MDKEKYEEYNKKKQEIYEKAQTPQEADSLIKRLAELLGL